MAILIIDYLTLPALDDTTLEELDGLRLTQTTGNVVGRKAASDTVVLRREKQTPSETINDDIADELGALATHSPTGSYLPTLSDWDEKSPANNNPWTYPDSFTWNTNCWANSLDWTGIGSYGQVFPRTPITHLGAGGVPITRPPTVTRFSCVTLVSPRHLIGAWHNTKPPFLAARDEIYFVKADGTIHIGVVEGIELIDYESDDYVDQTGVDLAIIYLTEDVPSGVNYYKVINPNFTDTLVLNPEDFDDGAVRNSAYYAPTKSTGLGGKPLVFTDQERNARIGGCSSDKRLPVISLPRSPELLSIVGYVEDTNGDLGDPGDLMWGTVGAVFDDYFYNPTGNGIQTGDSGSPVFLLLDGELIALSFHTSNAYRTVIAGTNAYSNAVSQAAINASMTSLEGVGGPGYQLTLADMPSVIAADSGLSRKTAADSLVGRVS